MIPWFTPRMTGGELFAIQSVLDSGFVNDGPVTTEFEREIARLVNRRYAVAVPNGTLSIAAALMACDAVGSDVIVPDLTYIATANAVKLAGANVVLADIDPTTFCLSSRTIEAVRTAKTKFVLVVEVNGRSPNYEELIPWCNAHDLTLITDSCESLGSNDRNGRPLGSCGKASCFSFSPNKIITTGQGGMVVTDDEKMHHRLMELKQQGMAVRGTGGADKHSSLGYNFKFTDIQAAMGLAQLTMFEVRRERMIKRDGWYRSALRDVRAVRFPGDVYQSKSANLWADIIVDHMYKLAAHLKANDVGARQFWIPLHNQQPYRFEKNFPVATAISATGIWLPSSYDITQEQVEQVAQVIKRGLRL